MKAKTRQFLDDRITELIPEIDHNRKEAESYIIKALHDINIADTDQDIESVRWHVLRHAKMHAQVVLDDVQALMSSCEIARDQERL